MSLGVEGFAVLLMLSFGRGKEHEMLADAIARILELATDWLPQAALDQIMNLLG